MLTRTVHPSCPERHADVGHSALTRLDVVAALAALALLGVVTLPVLAGNRERSLRLQCVSNLQQVGQGHHQWSTDHSGRLPVRTPWCEGGTSPLANSGCTDPPPLWVTAGLFNNVWFHYAPLSNELRSPKVLVCPADLAKAPASEWGNSSASGFLHPNFRNRATSYIVGTDIIPELTGAQLMTVDRNFPPDGIASACSSGLAPTKSLNSRFSTNTFDGSIHPDGGNILFLDGAVEQVSNAGFIRMGHEAAAGQMNGTFHYVSP